MWNSVPRLSPLCDLVLETDGPTQLPHSLCSHSPVFHWLAHISVWMTLQHGGLSVLPGSFFPDFIQEVVTLCAGSSFAFLLPALQCCSSSLELHVFISESLLTISTFHCSNKIPEINTLEWITFGSQFERFLANGWVLLTCSFWACGIYTHLGDSTWQAGRHVGAKVPKLLSRACPQWLQILSLHPLFYHPLVAPQGED